MNSKATLMEQPKQPPSCRLNSLTHRWFAMGTVWELAIYADRPDSYLQTAADEAQREVERLESRLSFYLPQSELCDLNKRAYWEEVIVDPPFFEFLRRAKALSLETGGAFDPTIAPLMRCWGFVGGSGAMPKVREIEAARYVVGMSHVLLNDSSSSVRYDREGVTLEFGAIGKGYAVENVVEILKDYEIVSALIHGGTSTIYGLGAPPEQEAWQIAIQRPNGTAGESLTTISLRDSALSVSAPHGKFFEAEGKRYSHVLDPRSGFPVQSALLAAVVTENPTDSDALSTALLTLGAEGIPLIRSLRPNSRLLLAVQEEGSQLQLLDSLSDGSESGMSMPNLSQIPE